MHIRFLLINYIINYIKLVAWDRLATTAPVFSSVREAGLVFVERRLPL